MEKRINNIEDLPRDNRAAYRVPDGYFSELNNLLRERVEQPAQGGIWATFRSMATFAAGFVAMVVLAITGFYFTGHQAQNVEAEYDELYLTSLYDITVEDIISAEETTDSTSSRLFADAAIDYLDTYGYNLADLTE